VSSAFRRSPRPHGKAANINIIIFRSCDYLSGSTLCSVSCSVSLQVKEAEAVGILQKAMVTILKSQQLRDVLVYTTLLFVFAVAWVSYRWPVVTVPAIAIACIVLGGEALLICVSIRHLRRQQ
jgi:hypothetical protein